MNEILLASNLVLVYLSVLGLFYFFGKQGLYGWICLGVVLANIEVTIGLDAFGLSQTMGNITFASIFLATDLLSEHYGKKASKTAVNLSIFSLVIFLVISNMWLLIEPNSSNYTLESFKVIFMTSSRVVLSSLVVFIIVQRIDVWIYHKVWSITTGFTNSKSSCLWVRNNVSTIASQILNNILFTLLAFYGVLPIEVIVDIMLASLIISFITSVMDTPVMYLSKIISKKEKTND